MTVGSSEPVPAGFPQLDQVQAFITQNPQSATVWLDALNLGRDLIHQQFVAGASAASVLHARTAVVDLVLIELWKREGTAFEGLTLIAVGGYGRGELHPASDIDIAILVPRHGDEKTEAVLSTWITRLWDLQLDIGHSVRTVSDCEREAGNDITVITNLMEARLLVGEANLYRLMQEVTSTAHMWTSAEFYRAKMEEQDQRHEKFQTNAYRLEPNIKESQGGLRDYQTIAWVCQRQFGTRGLEPLVSHGLLEPDELESLQAGMELLWRIRYLLHHLAGRHEDRLLFDHQRDIAHAFGFTDDTQNRSIEALMQRFYRTVMRLQRLNEFVLQGVGGIISGITAGSDIIPINSRFQLRNGYLEVTHDDVFVHYPPALLELFLVFGNTPEANNVRSHTVRLIRANLRLINERFRSDPAVRALFMQIFSNPNKLTRKIRMMNRYGVMAAYIPAFDAIVGRMQYDLFHIYTVDEHTVLVIRNLRRLAVPKYFKEFPQCSKIATNLRRPDLLYLIALFHDIAKGRGGDHCELGAEDIYKFSIEHGLSAEDTELCTWVVRHHLIMSMTAQRKDIDDPAVQLDFAREVETIEHLDYLYLLTVADIRATNPELWNSFKESLLRSLYRHALLILQRGLDNPLNHDDVIARRQAHTLTLLDKKFNNDPRLRGLWNSLGTDYFQQYQAAEIARHTEILLLNNANPGPLVNLAHSPSRGSAEILIYSPDDIALFALIATVLESLQLDVLSATINTSAAGHALDTFHVLEADGNLIEEPHRINDIESRLLQELNEPRDIPSLGEQRPSRRLRHFDVTTQVHFEELDSGLTAVRITAADRPGILSSIGRVLLKANIAVHAANITTLGERIDNVFFVRTGAGEPFSDASQRSDLAEQLKERL
ncbi:MAG: [protein-PII] uridylyltransferase [Granulosicoccus sp.]